MPKLIFATRPSKLARWQTRHVIDLLESHWEDLHCEEVVITTRGDQVIDQPLPEIGGKGVFTLELEEALHAKQVDIAVHSLKDLPTDSPAGLAVGAIPARAPVNDVLICPQGHTLAQLPHGAVVGTSSIRRQAQLLALRPDLQITSIRGNIDTRIRKVQDGQYDAILLAAAGVERLGLDEHITEYLSTESMMPAPGQGALAIQCRADDPVTQKFISSLENSAARKTTLAERTFLSGLGGGCSLPVGAHARIIGTTIELQAVVASSNGQKILRFKADGTDPVELGNRLVREALAHGARAVLNT